jgi:MoaA/NifB/PqqE/SkfB family radical SAM enzyme
MFATSPSYVQIEPVGQCNLRCRMCPIPFRQDGPPYGPPAFMAFDVFTRLIDQFANLHELHLQGLGEPMMHPRFADMVAYATRKGVRVTTNSNLTLLNPQRAERCITSGLAAVFVSVDGASAEVYERIRVRSRLEKVLHNLRLLREARENFASRTPEMRMVVVVMRQNLHELPELIRLAHREGMAGVFVQHLCHDFGESSLPPQYRPMRDFVQEQTLMEVDTATIERWFGETRAVAQELNLELRLPRSRPRPHDPDKRGADRCSWPYTGAYISYQGLAMPCCMIATPDRMNFGSMAEAGVEAIWNGDGYRTFRARLASDEPPEICRSCAIYSGTF